MRLKWRSKPWRGLLAGAVEGVAASFLMGSVCTWLRRRVTLTEARNMAANQDTTPAAQPPIRRRARI